MIRKSNEQAFSNKIYLCIGSIGQEGEVTSFGSLDCSVLFSCILTAQKGPKLFGQEHLAEYTVYKDNTFLHFNKYSVATVPALFVPIKRKKKTNKNCN